MSSLQDQAGALDQVALANAPSWSVRARAIYDLGKPNLSALVVMTGVIGFYLASGPIDWPRFVHFVIGLFGTSMGACGLNMVVERDIDARMQRTRTRPIPSGRISARGALFASLLMFGIGAVELAVFVNLLTASLALLTLVIYIFAYTPLKRWGPVSTWVGAIPGAIPPLMGWSAVRGQIDAPAVVLFGILFFWQLPHFLALAWIFREDYKRAGYRMLPGRDGTIRVAGLQMTICCLALIKVSLLLIPYGGAGPVYVIGAAIAGGVFLYFSSQVVARMDPKAPRRVFLTSIVYLPVLLAFIVADRVLLG